MPASGISVSRTSRQAGSGSMESLSKEPPPTKARADYEDVRITHCQAHDNAHTGIYVTGVYDVKTTRYANAEVYIGHCVAYDNPGDPKFLSNHSGSGIFSGKCRRRHSSSDAWRAITARYVRAARAGPSASGRRAQTTSPFSFVSRITTTRARRRWTGAGFDLDGGVTNSLLQYNYSHDNDGAGYLIYAYPNAPHTFRGNVVRYNISQNDGRKHQYAGIDVGGDVRDCAIFNNTIWIGPAANANPCDLITDGRNMRYCNNLLVTTGGVPLLEWKGGEDPTLRGNCYWSSGDKFQIAWNNKTYDSLAAFQTATGQEKKAVNGGNAAGLQAIRALPTRAAALLDNADKLNTLNAYRLLPDSPLRNAGVNMLCKHCPFPRAAITTCRRT